MSGNETLFTMLLHVFHRQRRDFGKVSHLRGSCSLVCSFFIFFLCAVDPHPSWINGVSYYVLGPQRTHTHTQTHLKHPGFLERLVKVVEDWGYDKYQKDRWYWRNDLDPKWGVVKPYATISGLLSANSYPRCSQWIWFWLFLWQMQIDLSYIEHLVHELRNSYWPQHTPQKHLTRTERLTKSIENQGMPVSSRRILKCHRT